MAQTKFDKMVEEEVEALALGIGRFLSGRPLRGERPTDATFFRAGRRVLPDVEERRIPRSAYRAGWQRLASRLASLGATGGVGYWAPWEHQEETFTLARDLWANPDPVLDTLQSGGIGAGCALTAGGIAYGLLTRRRREFMREWMIPLHEALAVPLGISELTDPRRYLHMLRNFADDAEIRIDVPAHMRFSEDLVTDLVKKKLALENVSFTWQRAGRNTHVVVKKRKTPPKMLRLSDPRGARDPGEDARVRAADRLRRGQDEGLCRSGRRLPARPDLRGHRHARRPDHAAARPLRPGPPPAQRRPQHGAVRSGPSGPAGRLCAPGAEHPWQGRRFTVGWGSREVLDAVLVAPAVVLEVSADVAHDSAGRWRHPVRPHQVRTDLDGRRPAVRPGGSWCGRL
ncbi:hypothetical protein ABZ318_26680 [Streptomyces sp. NPDC006197]|uniref:hypothetical protein n=1 Tax=Streptomyces sp. NPDC006197 TaxID=3156685 RepID=UPI00339FC1B0